MTLPNHWTQQQREQHHAHESALRWLAALQLLNIDTAGTRSCLAEDGTARIRLGLIERTDLDTLSQIVEDGVAARAGLARLLAQIDPDADMDKVSEGIKAVLDTEKGLADLMARASGGEVERES